jgi:hypothetical protein
MNSIKEYGTNKGSQGYGLRKSNKMNIKGGEIGIGALKNLSQKSILGKAAFLVGKELI